MFSLDSDYVSTQALENLKLYKYASVDKSFTTHYILRHYWDWAVKLFPLWMAPNLITLLGFFFILGNLAMMFYYIPDLIGPGPSWLYFSFAIGLWLYSTFDNVDGRQARRTKTSSPLGELFDHGCDSLNCSFGAVLQAAAMGLGYSWHSVAMLVLTTLPFYLSTWEEYHTGILYLGYVNGPTEGLIIACTLMMASGIWGPQIWTLPIRSLFGDGTPSFIPTSFTLVDVMCIGMFSLLVTMHIPFSLWAVHSACKRRKTSFLGALYQLVPMLGYIGAGWAWLAAPNSRILEDHYVLFALTVGIVFGRVATKIILAHVTKMPFPMFTVLLVPLFVGAIMANIPTVLGTGPVFTANSEYYFLLAYFVFSLIAYLHWAFLVIDRFCSFLGIRCLHIPHPSKRD